MKTLTVKIKDLPSIKNPETFIDFEVFFESIAKN